MMKNILLLALLICAVSACNKDDDDSSNTPNGCTTQAYTEAYADELEAVSNAAAAYSLDQSEENCKAYKTAYLSYVDALEDWAPCTALAAQTTQWELAIENAKDAADNLMCD